LTPKNPRKLRAIKDFTIDPRALFAIHTPAGLESFASGGQIDGSARLKASSPS
jgi:hypothetical protein